MFQIRPIEESDNPQIESVIRTVLTEYGANRPGFAWQDPQLRQLFQSYQVDRCGYWVVVYQGEIVGGVGVAPVQPSVTDTAELQKMYLLSHARGLGIGKALMQVVCDFARAHYRWLYLETFHTMTEAQQLYVDSGFMPLPQALISTEHNSCDRWYLKHLR